MFAYLKGELSYKSPTYVHLETGGIGYMVHISLNSYAGLEKLEKVKLWIYQHIKEDAHTLYGFMEEAEKNLFIQLLSVSGIGPNTARMILSSMTTQEVRSSIANESVVAFNKVKGVGPKTAKRIILDLKDKIIKEGIEPELMVKSPSGSIQQEALSALQTLGFQRLHIKNALAKAYSEEMGVEELIKAALKQLSK